MKRIALFICLGLSQAISAQEKEDTAELVPVEVKAIRAGATAPFAKTNISRQEIRRQNLGQDLPFLLNQTPSVVVNSDAGNGIGYTGIRIRGTDATRINVTLNGIPYNDAESQGTFFVDLPDFASSVNSIQVQRGVGTSTNGPGAFGATINFSTHEVNRQAYAELNNSFGSFNTLKNTLRVGTGLLSDHFTADFRASRVSSDGYIDRATSDLNSLYFSGAYLSGNTNLRLTMFTGKQKTYQAWNGVSEADLATNRTINYAGMEKPGEPYNDETDNYLQNHFQFFFDQKLGSGWTFNTALFLTRGKGYYEQYKAGEDYADYGMGYPMMGNTPILNTDLVRQLWLDNYYYGNIFSFQHRRGATELSIGGAATQYDGRHFGQVVWAEQGLTAEKAWYDLDAVKKDLNVYAKWQQTLSSRWQLFTDLQYRTVDYDLEGFRDNPGLFIYNKYNFLNPKIGFTYSHDNWRAFASYSQANKEPNRDDFEAGAGQQPRPEQLHDWELGVEGKRGGWNWSANLYYMNYKDQLVLTGRINDVGAYTRTNIPDSYRAGIELQTGGIINHWFRASGNLTLSRNRVKDFTEYTDDYDNGGQKTNFYEETALAFSPSVIGSATLTFNPIKAFSVDLPGKYVSRQYLDNTAALSRSLAPFYTQDIRAIYSLSRGRLKKAELILQANNIFNKKYEPNGYTFSYYYNNQLTTGNYYFPMAGRTFLVGVNVGF
jgi:iron complex outermembrane receptor protein